MFHSQITEIQPFKVQCFSTKMLQFQQYNVIFCDVSADFGISFRTYSGLAMSYPCVKFHHDMAIINNGINCSFMYFVLCIFEQATEVSV